MIADELRVVICDDVFKTFAPLRKDYHFKQPFSGYMESESGGAVDSSHYIATDRKDIVYLDNHIDWEHILDYHNIKLFPFITIKKSEAHYFIYDGKDWRKTVRWTYYNGGLYIDNRFLLEVCLVNSDIAYNIFTELNRLDVQLSKNLKFTEKVMYRHKKSFEENIKEIISRITKQE